MNPFSGNQIPPIYTPKTYVDPVTGVVYELDPSGYFWNQTSHEVPAGHQPTPGGVIPPAIAALAKNAHPMNSDAIVYNSAIQKSIENENKNRQTYERWVQAYIDFKTTGKANQPPFPEPYYAISDFGAVLFLIQNGIGVPVPPEANF